MTARYVITWDLETWDKGRFASQRAFGGFVVIEAEARIHARNLSDELMDVDFMISHENPGSMGHHSAWRAAFPVPIGTDEEYAVGQGRCNFHVTSLYEEVGLRT